MPIKVGIAGYGARGERLDKRMESIEEFEVVGVYDSNPKKKLGLRSGIKWYESLEDVLRSEIDMLIIATPPGTHHNLGVLALESGKDVFMEKPSTLKFEDDEDLEKKSRSYGRLIGVGYGERFNPAATELIEKINAAETIDFDETRMGWRPTKMEYPGIEFDVLSHSVNTGTYIFGSPKVESSEKKISETYEKSEITLTFGSHVQSTLKAEFTKDLGYVYRMASIRSLKAYYLLDYAGQKLFEFVGPPKIEGLKNTLLGFEEYQQVSKTTDSMITCPEEPIPIMMRCFAQSIQRGEIQKPMCSISEAKVTTKTIEDAIALAERIKG